MRHRGETSSSSAPGTGGDWHTLGRLLPYLWSYKWRVLLALACLVTAKFANVGVPLVMKEIVDQLDSRQAVLALPLALLVVYGVLRLSNTLFAELRDIVARARNGAALDETQIERLFADLGQRWSGLDGLVHSIAYAPRDQLVGDYLESVTREGLRIAHRHGLDDAVGRSCFHLQALGQALDALAVDRVHHRLALAEDALELAAGCHGDGMARAVAHVGII